MQEISERAWAKLNISLDVTARRDDGYHDMLMVMQTVSLCDTLRIRPVAGEEISASSNLRFVPGDERNLAVRAAKRILEALGERQGLHIEIKKQIPVGAGMAGGSADAAAVLRALNRAYGGRLSKEELLTLAAEVGSDVPFCLGGGTALARGRGEVLEALPPLPDCWFALCKPSFSISTPEFFRKLDSAPIRARPDTAGILAALDSGDLPEICRRMYNVFEDVDDRRLRVVPQIKSILLDHGALGAIMTGTGSAVFGVYETEAQARAAVDALRREYRFAYIARPVRTLL